MSRVQRRSAVRASGSSKDRQRHLSGLERLEHRRLLAAHIVGNSTIYATIQAAVDAAAAGQTVTVDAGSYTESVVIYKQLTVKGAKAGIDGRSNARAAGAGESIVTGALLADGKTAYGFRITTSNVTLDGFTVQGQTSQTTTLGAAVVMGPNISGTKVLNNIVQNNVVGLYLSNNSSSNAALVQGNIFRSNNNAGYNLGRGIYSDGGVSGGLLTNVTIDNNFFYNNLGDPTFLVQPAIGFEAASLGSQTNLRVTNNAFERNGKAILAYNVNGLLIEGNVVGNHWDVSSAALRFEGGDTNVTITKNNIYASGGRAIRIDNKASSGSNNNFTITQNNIYQNGLEPEGERTGLYINANGYDGNLNATNNYWGSSSGPSGDAPGTGDALKKFTNVVTYSPFATTYITQPQVPFYGTNGYATTGAPIQAEDYDHGWDGISYKDTSSANSGGSYRPIQGVDISSTTDGGAGYMVSSARATEWLEYSLNVPASGTYRFDARVQTGNSGGVFHLEIDGVNVSGAISMANTSNAFATISKAGINLTAGNHILRVAFDTNNSGGSLGNWNWVGFFPTSVTPPPNAPTNLAANATSSSSVSLAWTDNSNNETGFIIERKVGNGGAWSTLVTTAVNATSHIDNTAAPNTAYFYRVRAASSALGDSANSNEASATTPPNNTTYLSDLEWVGTPINGYGPAEKDRANGGTLTGDGNILTLNGATYAKGLGTHADSEIIYNLGGAYTNFMSDIGVDDGTGAGSVIFQVWADNVKVYESPVMTQAGQTLSISVPVAGVQQLKLVTTNGGDNYSWDWGDWANARLVLTTQPAPSAPTNLVATAAGSGKIDLTWTDNATNESGFILERSLNGSGGWQQIGAPAANAVAFSDTSNLSANTQYFYRLRATNSGGDSANSNMSNATTQALPAPGAPTNLVATATSGSQINLTWTDNANNETGFILERSPNGSGGWQQIATPLANATSFSDTNLSIGTQYFYRVRATNGTLSTDSNTANATTLNISTATYIPLGSTWKYLDTGTNQGTAWRALAFADATWKSGAAELGYGDGDEATVVGFGSSSSAKFITTYFRKTFNVADPALVSAPTLRVKRDDGAVIYVNGTEVWRSNMPTGTIAYNTAASSAVEEETLYTVAFNPALLIAGDNIVAVEIHQESKTSSDISFNLELTATVTAPSNPPANPSNLLATAAGQNQINLSWTDNATNENGFVVERSPDGVSNWLTVGTPVANATSYSDSTGLAPDTTYYYRVRATNGAGPSDNSNIANGKTDAPPLPTAPAAPTSLVASALSGTLQINLTWTDASNNETGFVIERSPDGSSNWEQIATPAANATSHSDTLNLSAGTQYFYRVRATNNVGPSSDSNIANATTATAPSAPSNLVATAAPNALTINLTWTDNASNETGFIVERSLDGVNGWQQIATPAANATSYSNTTGLSAATQYFYRVRAVNAIGASANSDASNATTLAAPTAPGNLAATTISASQIGLTWTDGSSNESGFILERSLNGSTGWVQIATPAANATQYGDSGLSAGTQYWYRIRAANAAGASSDSGIASATTFVSQALPAPWSSADIGAVTVAGSASGVTGGQYTVKGSGVVGGTADSLRFVYQQVSGNGSFYARVNSIDNVDPLALAGVMIRTSLAANSANAGLFLNASGGITFTRRTTAGGATTSTTTANVAGPYYLRLSRSGTTITAARSTNGTTWTTVGTVTITGLPTSFYVGVAVASNKAGSLATAVFSDLD